MRYVYALMDSNGNVVYVGETKSTRWRLYDHTRRKRGKFYGRTDIRLHVLSAHETRSESYWAQCHLQKVFGLRSEDEMSREHLAKGRKILQKKRGTR